MAEAVRAVVRAGVPGGVFVMGGHREGLVAFGRTPDEAGKRLLAVHASHATHYPSDR
jgi:hypothetical protein